jgi:hypothetical protein
VIYANTSKSNKKKCTINANEDQILFYLGFGIFGSLFATTWFVFANQNIFPISKSNTLVCANKEVFQDWNGSIFKNSPFSRNKKFSPIRDHFCNKSILTKKNSSSSIFKSHKWLADPFALALISPPLALSNKTGSFLALLTPLSIKSKKQWEHKYELGIKYTNTGVQWKSLRRPSSFSLSMYLRDYIKCTQTNKLVSKESNCSTSPPKHVHICIQTCEVQGGLVQLEHHKWTITNFNCTK